MTEQRNRKSDSISQPPTAKTSLYARRLGLLIGISLLTSLSLSFQNCSKMGASSSPSNPPRASLDVKNLSLSPFAATVAPQASLQLQGSGGDPSTYRFTVKGKGTVDQLTGLYVAPSTTTDDVVELSDSSGTIGFAFIKVANPGDPMALAPAAALLPLSAKVTFIGLGGKPPFQYSVSPATFGTIDSSSGLFTASNSPGSATVTATDADGKQAQATVTVDDHATSPLTPFYVPNPLQVGQTAIVYHSGFQSGFGLELIAGPGSVFGLTYSPGYQFGPSTLRFGANGQSVNITVPIVTASPTAPLTNADLLAMTSITMQTPCPAGSTYRGVMFHGEPNSNPQFLNPPDQFCYFNDPNATKVVSDVFVTDPKDDAPLACPAGYITGERPIFDCESSYLAGIYVYCSKWQFQNLCYKLDTIGKSKDVYSTFYLTAYTNNINGQMGWGVTDLNCDAGDSIVGTTTNCYPVAGSVAQCNAANKQYFCAHKPNIPH